MAKDRTERIKQYSTQLRKTDTSDQKALVEAFQSIPQDDRPATLNELFATSQRKEEITQKLLHHAAQLGKEEIVKCLIRYEIDPMAESYEGKNTLHYAATGGNLRIVQYLLDPSTTDHSFAISPNTQSVEGKTALDYAPKGTEAYLYLLGYTEGYNAGQDSLMEG